MFGCWLRRFANRRHGITPPAIRLEPVTPAVQWPFRIVQSEVGRQAASSTCRLSCERAFDKHAPQSGRSGRAGAILGPTKTSYVVVFDVRNKNQVLGCILSSARRAIRRER
jgi:hypothetical protein